MMSTMEYLQAQLAMLDRRLAGHKAENAIYRQSQSRTPKEVVQPTRRKFLVLVEGTEYVAGKKGAKGKIVDTIRSIPLTASTIDPKYYATSMHKETNCIVRVV